MSKSAKSKAQRIASHNLISNINTGLNAMNGAMALTAINADNPKTKEVANKTAFALLDKSLKGIMKGYAL